MAEPNDDAEEAPTKKSKLPVILGLVLAVAGGGGGYVAVSSGMLPLGGSSGDPKDTSAKENTKTSAPKPLGDIAFVPVPQIVVSLGPNSQASHLRFSAQLEVPSKYEGEVTTVVPRVVDVLNDYLRALRPEDIEAHGALFSLRAQMLRRVQIVTGESRVKDLLVMEFILN